MSNGDANTTPVTGSELTNEALSVAAPRQAYNPQQQMFDFGDPYEHLETRTGTTEQQRAVGRSALADVERRLFVAPTGLWQGATLLGSAISRDFRGSGGVQLIGQPIRSARDLAALAQVFRDPRFETFRVIFVDAADHVVGGAAYSSRLPAVVYLPGNFAEQIEADRIRFGATGYWMLHNHPSGSSTPSAADKWLTQDAAAKTEGFKGHVVIDHIEYSVIDVINHVAMARTIQAPDLATIDFKHNPEKPHPVLGRWANNSRIVADIAKSLQVRDNYIALVGTDSPGQVTFVVEIPVANLQVAANASRFTRHRFLAQIRRLSRETGAGAHLFAITPDKWNSPQYKILRKPGLLTDVVDMEGGSASEKGIMEARTEIETARTRHASRKPDWYVSTGASVNRPAPAADIAIMAHAAEPEAMWSPQQ